MEHNNELLELSKSANKSCTCYSCWFWLREPVGSWNTIMSYSSFKLLQTRAAFVTATPFGSEEL